MTKNYTLMGGAAHAIQNAQFPFNTEQNDITDWDPFGLVPKKVNPCISVGGLLGNQNRDNPYRLSDVSVTVTINSSGNEDAATGGISVAAFVQTAGDAAGLSSPIIPLL